MGALIGAATVASAAYLLSYGTVYYTIFHFAPLYLTPMAMMIYSRSTMTDPAPRSATPEWTKESIVAHIDTMGWLENQQKLDAKKALEKLFEIAANTDKSDHGDANACHGYCTEVRNKWLDNKFETHDSFRVDCTFPGF